MGACVFKAYEFLSKDYRAFDASELPDGTIINMSVWAFFKLDNPVEHRQVLSRCIEKIYTIAKRRYNDSLEPLHPCERPGER